VHDPAAAALGDDGLVNHGVMRLFRLWERVIASTWEVTGEPSVGGSEGFFAKSSAHRQLADGSLRVCLVLFLVSLHCIRPYMLLLARLGACNQLVFGCQELQSLAAYNWCLVAMVKQ
jgi:hypothetical protein